LAGVRYVVVPMIEVTFTIFGELMVFFL